MEDKHKINKKCSRCGGTNVVISVNHETGISSKVCQDCGSWSYIKNRRYYLILIFAILFGIFMMALEFLLF